MSLVFTAVLSGSEEVPAAITAEYGSVTVTVHDDWAPPLIYMDIQAEFAGISGGWTFAGLYGPASPG